MSEIGKMNKDLLETANYLNVGCGNTRFDDCINMDIADNPLVAIDIVGDVLNIPFPNDRFKGVIFSHVLEHLIKRDHTRALYEIRRVLKDHGTMYLEVPDFKKIVQFYLENYQGREEWWYDCIFGREYYQGDIHRAGITERYLTDLLFDCGFGNLKWSIVPNDNPYLAVVAEKLEELPEARI
jgi:predicted SAM-dependent methyltransferase